MRSAGKGERRRLADAERGLGRCDWGCALRVRGEAIREAGMQEREEEEEGDQEEKGMQEREAGKWKEKVRGHGLRKDMNLGREWSTYI